jgi:5-methylcytosine-specific restriction endonuclease McrA
MGRKKKLIDKVIKKKIDKRCKFCGEEDYCLLDVHRIIPGSEGGKYTESNTVSSCSNCHRKIHDGKIKIDRKYPSTAGWVLHYFDEYGAEHWD